MAVYLYESASKRGAVVGADTAAELVRWAIRLDQMVDVTSLGLFIRRGNLARAREVGAVTCPKNHVKAMLDRNVYQIRKYGGVKKLRAAILGQ
jgi:hypothetical protein